MKSSFVKKSGSLIELDVELLPEEFKKYWDEIFEGELANVHLKGFRPGQAPKELASKAVDPEKVFQKAANDAVRFSLNEIVQDNNWTVIDKPKITILPGDPSTSLRTNLGFEYRAEITLFPEIDLGDYKKIAHKSYGGFRANKKEATVASEEIDKTLDFVKKSGANLENFKSDEDLKKSIGDGLKLEKEEKENEIQRIKVLGEIITSAKVDVPQVMVDRTLQSYSGQARSAGQAKEMSEEQARKNVIQHLVIYKIAETEKLNPTPDEVGEQLQKYYGGEFDPVRSRDRDKRSRSTSNGIDKQQLYDYVYGVLQSKKVFQFLEKL